MSKNVKIQVASGGWDRDVMAQQLQPLLSLWSGLTENSTVLRPVRTGKTPPSLPVDVFVEMEATSAHQVRTQPCIS